jgi:multidrug efflux pump
VTTAYVGASAELVRGFVTQPLERAIAAADGIDYLESSSSLGISKITARLKLNYDAKKALAEVNAKINEVRKRIAAGSGNSDDGCEDGGSRRSPPPCLTFFVGNSRAESNHRLPRAHHPAAARRRRWTACRKSNCWAGAYSRCVCGSSPTGSRLTASARTRSGRRCQRITSSRRLARAKSSLVQINLTANTDLRSVEEFKQLVVKENGGQLVRLSDVADVVLGAGDYDSDVRFSGEHAVFAGVWVLPNANSLDVIKRVRTEMAAIRKRNCRKACTDASPMTRRNISGTRVMKC